MIEFKCYGDKLFHWLATNYIDLVYRTSLVRYTGKSMITCEEERFVLGFWHGDSYCIIPALKGTNIFVITTSNRRGDYIANLCEYFGYTPLRVPDESVGGGFLFKIRKKINGADGGHLALAFDGPLGPYHVPKDFSYILARVSKRRIVPVSIEVKRKIRLTRRWDKYMVPLPFNQISVHFHEPIPVLSKELDPIKQRTVEVMESRS